MYTLQVAEFLRNLPPQARFRLGRTAAYLADDSSDTETLLFEAALDDFEVAIDGDASGGVQELSLQVCRISDCCIGVPTHTTTHIVSDWDIILDS